MTEEPRPADERTAVGDDRPAGDGRAADGTGAEGAVDDSSLFVDEDHREEMRAILEEGDHDVDLGLELARDAQRVVAGDIDEETFRERYHDAVVEEFGQDGRVLGDALADAGVDGAEDLTDERVEGRAGAGGPGPRGDLQAALSSFDPDDEQSRRELLKTGGVAAVALSLGLGSARDGTASASEGSADHAGGGDDVQYGMVINLNNCDGCLACMVACTQDNNLSRGSNWMYVMAFEDAGQGEESLLVRPCQHCDEAACEKVCPVGARHTRTKDGIVLSDYEICIGCRYCQVACPYGVNYFQWDDPDVPESELARDMTYDERGRRVDSRPVKGTMGKCTFCPTRQDGMHGDDKVGTTACEDACAMDAIHFGDMNDPESAPNRHLERYREDQPNDDETYPARKDHTVSTFRLLEEMGTDPNVVYVGDEPGPNAHQVEGPVAYEDVGLVDNRKEQVLEQGADGGETA